MSDSFADLWNSTAPTKPVQPQKLGSVTSNNVPKRPQHDVFSLLSSAGSSNTSSRSITPSMPPQQRSTLNLAPKPTSTSGDAFSDLLTGSLAVGTNGGARMTIAERAAEVERHKLEGLRRHATKSQAPTPWDGLDTLGKSTISPSPKPSAASSSLEDDWGLDAFVSQPASKANSVKPSPPIADEDDGWLGDFAVAPISQPKAAAPIASSNPRLWTALSTPPPPLPERKHTDSPGDFDFGNREDALLDDDSNDEDDILGALSKPVDSIPKRKSPSDQTRPTSPPSRPNASFKMNEKSSRPISPPPHILGQIVEMGFSVQQARVALASTDTGLDVQSALETLLSNTASSSQTMSQPQSPDYLPPGQQPRSATRLMPQDRDTPSPSNSQLDRDHNIQEHADKLLSQASEIGLSVFNKASSFWKEGKERVQKAYVERAAASGTSTPAGVANGRPRWMQEPSAAAGTEDGWTDGHKKSSFSDDVAPQRARPTPQPKRAPKVEPQPEIVDLFAAEPTVYASPFRRAKPQQAAVAATPQAPPARPAPVRITQRQNVVSASASSISRSTKHKDLGAEKFKLGQYGDAEAAYTSAIACLPNTHLLLVPLYNNRALTRLKTGDHTGAVEDATRVVDLIGARYHPAREAKVAREEEGSGVDLGDGLVKALKRRAEALEGREKWEEAERDWSTVASAEWAKGSVKGEAVRGAGRCRRMVQAALKPPAPKPKSSAKPPPPRRPAPPRGTTPPSQALENLRAAGNAAEAEDQQRHELKDSVDAKLLAWKGGKEANIRALLGSLDTVLWPELGLQKSSMADLISPSQVKIRYTKTIAKLHPDKLNANNTTVEQRMLANGVFGALNEAWNVFKQ